MSHYAVEIDPTNLNTSHGQVIDLLGDAHRVLDVGCWAGDLGRLLIERGCRVSGFELDPAAAAIAAEHLESVVVGDLDSAPLSGHFEAGSFDAIIFADVLEHIMDPVGVLADSVRLLAPGGRIVISIPNVTHGSLRLALLQGRWRTTDTGLLDRTHIRFFSRDSLLQMVADAGLVTTELRGTTADPLGVEVDVDPGDLPPGVLAWVRTRPDAMVYQFQLAVRPAREGEVPTEPELVVGKDPRWVRPGPSAEGFMTAAWRAELVERDRVIGLESTAETATAEARRLRGVEKRLRSRVAELEQAAQQEPAPSTVRRTAGRVRRRLRRR
ncbi:class I SAM-dependent methyltransferase [Aeromicrobium duanguangcaii]|uniref:class I SAM-dependent methyltransferase n=1 Tax=Aeromicrobium duanguangcaii TaxID=2968086 RepID=UPI002017E79A|nr:class I SAM-dependent methyltransferase [Aeromicrobium duanguangcaii]MCL3837904.1 class I SAM-dependent methyltransferase [Aeromicrobium duanguangcaii]